MPPNDEVVVTAVSPRVAMVRLNRPPHNFISQPLVTAIADAYEELARRGEARAIVLTAEGKNFCAGADFGGSVSGETAAHGPRLASATIMQTYSQGARLIEAPLPVIAAITGAAVGGGFGLACTADFRVGATSTRLAPNFAQLGVHHGFGLTVTLPLIVGFQRATELLLTGRRLGGEEGHRLGLLDRLTPEADLESEAIAFAEGIASSAPLSVRAMRATMRQGLAERFLQAAIWESTEQERLGDTHDFLEGVRATGERRPPVFEGR